MWAPPLLTWGHHSAVTHWHLASADLFIHYKTSDSLTGIVLITQTKTSSDVWEVRLSPPLQEVQHAFNFSWNHWCDINSSAGRITWKGQTESQQSLSGMYTVPLCCACGFRCCPAPCVQLLRHVPLSDLSKSPLLHILQLVSPLEPKQGVDSERGGGEIAFKNQEVLC